MNDFKPFIEEAERRDKEAESAARRNLARRASLQRISPASPT